MLPAHCEAVPLHRQGISVLHIVERTSLSLLMHVKSAPEK